MAVVRTVWLARSVEMNDTTMWACEQPCALGSGDTVVSVVLSVGVLGLIAAPLGVGTTIMESPCIAAAPTVTSSGEDQFAQCRVAVTLSDVLGDIDVVLLTVDGVNAIIVAVSLKDEAALPTLPETLMEGVGVVAVSLVDKDGEEVGDRDKLLLVLWKELSVNVGVGRVLREVEAVLLTVDGVGDRDKLLLLLRE